MPVESKLKLSRQHQHALRPDALSPQTNRATPMSVEGPRNVRRIFVRGSVPTCRLKRRKFRKFDYEMVHSEVYLNKYVVSIAPFSTSACPDCSQNIA